MSYYISQLQNKCADYYSKMPSLRSIVSDTSGAITNKIQSFAPTVIQQGKIALGTCSILALASAKQLYNSMTSEEINHEKVNVYSICLFITSLACFGLYSNFQKLMTEETIKSQADQKIIDDKNQADQKIIDDEKIRSKSVEIFMMLTDDEDIGLILETSADHNGAFDSDLPSSKYPLCYKKVSCIEDCNETISKLVLRGKKIHECWIRAHGNPHLIELGNGKNYNCLLDQSNISLFSSGLKKLEKDSDIILQSCSTGGTTNDGGKNIGCLISEWSYSKVHCPNLDASKLKIKKTNPLSVEYFDLDESISSSVYKNGMLLKG